MIIGIDIGLQKSTWISFWADRNKLKKVLFAYGVQDCVEVIRKNAPAGSIAYAEEPYLKQSWSPYKQKGFIGGRYKHNVKFHRDFSAFIGALKYGLELFGFKFYTVPPQTWQTQVLRILPHMGSERRKLASLRIAYYLTKEKRFLEENVSKYKKGPRKGSINFDDIIFDRADAINIGYYGASISKA